MTLTQEDLLAISELLDIKLEPVKEEIATLKEDVNGLKDDVAILKEDVAVLKEDVAVLKEDVAVLKEDVTLLKEDVTVLQEGQLRINLIIENELRPQIRLLAENYLPAAERYLEEAEHIKEMRSDIDMLKDVVAQHSQQLQALA